MFGNLYNKLASKIARPSCPPPQRLRLASFVIRHSSLVIGICALLASTRLHAFSLLGPLDAYANLANGANWPVERIGYNVFDTDIGVPVNLGEEYRWNRTNITYAYDSSFLNYFGQKGVEAIEAAIQIMNDLPPVSQINIDDYPTENKRLNDTARALGVVDIKSWTLATLLELFGLAAPERFVYTLRDRATVTLGGDTFTNYIVIRRNFDPVTLQPTNRVNGASYTFDIEELERPVDWADAKERQIFPLEFGYSSVAGALSSPVYNLDRFISTNFGFLFVSGNGGIGPGELFPGLTRDDVGGWRYLIRGPNWNVEQTTPGATRQIRQVLGPGGVPISVTNPIAPWTPVFVATNTFVNTNFFFTNAPWTPFFPITNIPPGGITNLPGTNIINTNFLDVALRPGVEKITFRRVNFDSLLGTSLNFTNRYTDVVISNFTRLRQPLEVVQTVPDIIFGAGDLGTTVNAESPVFSRRSVNRVNNDQLNGFFAAGGPGVLRGPMTLLFSDVLFAILVEASEDFYFEGETTLWGSFDETSDEVTVFPSDVSLQLLEEILRGRMRPNPNK